MAAGCDAMLLFLHESFVAFNEVLTSDANNWEVSKDKLQKLQEQWQQRGLFGTNAFNTIAQFQSQIKWQEMAPEQFGRFYRFAFYICREPGKRNLPMDMAVAVWRLTLLGRFRLLERWCAFAAASQARVVTEDTWRQVLEFSRIIHEDLSNYDSAGAWAVLLDEFVDEMRTSRRRPHAGGADGCADCRTLYGAGSSSTDLLLRQASSSGADLGAMFAGAGAAAGGGVGSGLDGDRGGMLADAGLGPSFMTCLSPRCGSKRREPDVDVVTEQLSAMPLGAVQHPHQGQGHLHHHHHHHQQQQQQQQELPGGGGGRTPVQGFGGGVDLSYGGYHLGADAATKRQCVSHYLQSQQQHQQPQPQGPSALCPAPQSACHQQPHPQAAALLQIPQHCCLGLGAATAAAESPTGVTGVALSGGGGLTSSRTATSGQPMSCSTGSVSSAISQDPVGSAAMDCVQDPLMMGPGGGLVPPQPQQPQQQQQHLTPLCQQQRRAIKARRSGLSDIVRSAVSDALGF